MHHRADVRIVPEPPEPDRAAILAAVEELLAREESLAKPPPWRLGGWVKQGVGIRDLGPHLGAPARWALSARLPWGGREFGGMNGRGDAK